MAAPSLCLSTVYVSQQRDAPSRSLARARRVAAGEGGGAASDVPGVPSHSYAPPFPPLTQAGRGQPHGSQDGYKRFQVAMWERRQRGGPWAYKTRRDGQRGVVAAPANLTAEIAKADAQMLRHAPIWLSWQSPYELQIMLNDRGLVTVELVPPTSEVGQVHVRGTVDPQSDPAGGQRDYGGAVSAAFGPTLGLVVLPSEVVAVMMPRSKPAEPDLSVPLSLHRSDVNLIRTSAKALQVLISHGLTLVLQVSASRVCIYQMSDDAVTVMHQRVPLQMLAQFSTEPGMQMWQFSRAHENVFFCLSQPVPSSAATILEFELDNELINRAAPLTVDVSSRVHTYEWSEDNLRLAVGCDDGTLGIHTRGGKMQKATVQGSEPVILVRWHPNSTVVMACLFQGDVQFFDLAAQPLFLVGENERSVPTARMTTHLDYLVRPLCAEWCRAKPRKENDEPVVSADLVAIAFDRGPLAILRVELPQVCGGGSALDMNGLVKQRISAASAHMLAQPPAYGSVKTEINAALSLLRCAKDKSAQGSGIVRVIEWLLISFGRRPDVVKGAKQEWALIGATLKEFWKAYSDPKSPSHDALAALYRCYFFEAMRRDAFEEAYDVAKVLPERKELFAELAQWATFRGEPDLAILATKEAGLDLKLFAVDASFDPQGQFNKIAKIEEKYENEHALSRDEVELYGLWLESHARYDEALGLYNLHEAHLPNERLLAGLASLRDPTMMVTTQDTQSLPPADSPDAALLPEDAVGAFPAIDRMLEADELYAEQLKVHATKLKAAKTQPTLAPK